MKQGLRPEAVHILSPVSERMSIGRTSCLAVSVEQIDDNTDYRYRDDSCANSCDDDVPYGIIDRRFAVFDEIGIGVASCFGIGMAQGETCGAATGAMMAIGIRYGNVKSGDLKTKSEVFAKRDEFIRRFAEMTGKVKCPDLLGRRVDTYDELVLLGATTDVFSNSRR